MESTKWDNQILNILSEAQKNSVKMLLVGGYAVNYYGYQRASKDIDFWLDPKESNIKNLFSSLGKVGFESPSIPKDVLKGEKNITLKISSENYSYVEFLTSFSLKKPFEEAYKDAQKSVINDTTLNVISYDDLIENKILCGRYKDLLDVSELKKISQIKEIKQEKKLPKKIRLFKRNKGHER